MQEEEPKEPPHCKACILREKCKKELEEKQKFHS